MILDKKASWKKLVTWKNCKLFVVNWPTDPFFSLLLMHWPNKFLMQKTPLYFKWYFLVEMLKKLHRELSLKIVWKMKRVQMQNNVSNRCETHTTETGKAILERIMRHDRYKDNQIVNSNKDYRNSQWASSSQTTGKRNQNFIYIPMQEMKNHFHIKMGIQNIFCKSFSHFIPSSVPKIVILQ